MQGLASIYSAVVSTGALVFTGWLLRHEIQSRREEKADSEAAQARLIACHVVDHDHASGGSSLYGPVTRLQWLLKNYSAAPIYDLEVTLDTWTTSISGLPIEDEAAGSVDCNPPIVMDQGMHFDPREIEVSFTYTDSAGLRWKRTMPEPPTRLLHVRPSLVARFRHWRNLRSPVPF
jgi:hypothetical protein